MLSVVFTRALMKKGLRHPAPPNAAIFSCFHACPDEEGITTSRALKLNLFSMFSRVP